MTRMLKSISLAAALLFVAGCAQSDATSPGTENEGGAINQEGEVGNPSTEDSVTPRGAEPGGEAADRGASVGDPAPAWENLVGTDDEKHSLKDLKGIDAVAVVFTCNHCPVAKAYEERLVKLADDYKDTKFQLVAINVNNVEGDRLPAMKERAEEQGFNFPYLYDPSQEIGRAYGATVTPHAFLLDKDRTIVYAGAIDNEMDESKVEDQYLRDAIDAVLVGEKLAVATTKPFGCGIKYE